ncbi:CYTH domain-containing protein [Marinobacterium arenosum]|uniref:CYTH domain-containing protein n=1 Tax=Marinobacterium arenosum TaxID=2862496 RepID=UPI001C95DEFC|nr:CYTH domain-containing protein [Marinobacterium arenosum]MBY4676445.1 CYTH domain-containing protein [Marinobacterium arenosum]
MAQEIELKLSFNPHYLGSLLQQPLFHLPETEAQGERELSNHYFDTADQALQRERVALRIRRIGERYIQTLKTRGQSAAGLHQRNEWEWELERPELDFARLAEADWPEALAGLDSSGIQPAFSTDFSRRLWRYRSRNADGKAVDIELALDRGEAWLEQDGERRSDPICELELELKQGQPADLFAVALELAHHVPLQICDISKAERGYRLHAPAQYRPPLERSKPTGELTLEQVYCQLLQQELQAWPRLLEAWQFSRQWQYVEQALASLLNVSALRARFSDLAPLKADDPLSPLLDKLIGRLQPLLDWQRCRELLGPAGTDWSAHQQEKAHQGVELLNQTLEPGLCALLLGQALQQRSWRQYWQPQHRERANQRLDQAE